MSFKPFDIRKLSTFDIIFTCIYAIISLVILLGGGNTNTIEGRKTLISIYSFLTPFILYVLLYKSLRNLRVFFIWVGIGFFHLYLYNSLIVDDALLFQRGHAADGLQFTLLFVVLFELLRIAHLKMTGIELVSLIAYGGTRDLWDNRKIRFSDAVCFFVYMPTWILLTILGGN